MSKLLLLKVKRDVLIFLLAKLEGISKLFLLLMKGLECLSVGLHCLCMPSFGKTAYNAVYPRIDQLRS